jgi:hypothetical protein
VFVHVPASELKQVLLKWSLWLKPGGHFIILTKHGEGEEIYHNLGDNLPRRMVFHKPSEFKEILKGWAIVYEAVWQPTIVADKFMALILEKPQ